MKSADKKKDSAFNLIRMNVDCVLFMRTRAPVDPLQLVREICKDAAVAKNRELLRSRFINKLTPITLTGKATEKGLEDVARKVLPDHFRMVDGETDANDDAKSDACSVSKPRTEAVPLPPPATPISLPVSSPFFPSKNQGTIMLVYD